MSIIKKFLFGWLVFMLACTNPSYTPPENGLDAGRQFADAIYKGNFKRATDLILPDEQNKALLSDSLEGPYHQLPGIDRNLLGQSSLQILEVDNQVKDSATFIHFLNAYSNRPATIKVVRSNGAWLVDVKYTFTKK